MVLEAVMAICNRRGAIAAVLSTLLGTCLANGQAQATIPLNAAENQCANQIQRQLSETSLAEEELLSWLSAVSIAQKNRRQWDRLMQRALRDRGNAPLGSRSDAERQRAIAATLCTNPPARPARRACSEFDFSPAPGQPPKLSRLQLRALRTCY